MQKKLLSIAVFAFFSIAPALAQKVLDAKENVKELNGKDIKDGWSKNGGIGLDFSLLNLINPRPGAGDNRTGFGGLLAYNANYKKDKLIWNNRFQLQLGVVKVAQEPWTKSNDVIQATSQFGRQISGKMYAAGLFDLQTQFLPTYGTNYLEEIPEGKPKQALTGRFFAPAIVRLAPGVIYKPNAFTTVLLSPLAVKGVIVNVDSLAYSGRFFPNPNRDKKSDWQLGAEIRIDFSRKFFNDKLIYTSTLDLYSNYLRNPQNIDVEWYNSIDFVIFKNISVNFRSDWFYDDDILVYRGGDINNKGRDIFGRNALLIKFNRVF